MSSGCRNRRRRLVRQLLDGVERRVPGEPKVLQPGEVVTLFYSFRQAGEWTLRFLGGRLCSGMTND